MKTLLLLLGLFGLPALAVGQEGRPLLQTVAEETRAQWQRQDAVGLVARSPQLLIQLPGADPSAPVGRRQASELLRDFFSHAEEVETLLNGAREVGGGWGLVELRRRYRISGTQEVREQLLLLSYRTSGKQWTLVELRMGR